MVSGTAHLQMQRQDRLQIYSHRQAEHLEQSIFILNRISINDKILMEIKTFNNKSVRAGEKIRNTSVHTINLIRFVEQKLNKEILKAKFSRY